MIQINLREVPVKDLRTGDRVISIRGRPGKILVMSDIGVKEHKYIVCWSIEGIWSNEKYFISLGYNLHKDLYEYPITEPEVKYIGL